VDLVIRVGYERPGSSWGDITESCGMNTSIKTSTRDGFLPLAEGAAENREHMPPAKPCSKAKAIAI
jgi:hypothetical protein